VATLANGVAMPWVGLGTWAQGANATSSVKAAIKAGYRSIDTGSFYQNEEDIGRGLSESGVNRQELFVTTKVWNSEHGYDSTLNSFRVSLKKLALKYIDLFLIHWPVKGKSNETWRALESLYSDGVIRSIGVSNFQIHHLDDLMNSAKIMPMVNQIDLHPLNTCADLGIFCKNHNIQVEAWGPLGQGEVFKIPVLIDMATRHRRSVAQLVLRWHYQNGVITIPKSSNVRRITENIDIFDFSLSEADMQTISQLNQNKILLGFDADHIPTELLQPPAKPWPYSL
jgi:diketogulonate reductase-like aldo/keto reductase